VSARWTRRPAGYIIRRAAARRPGSGFAMKLNEPSGTNADPAAGPGRAGRFVGLRGYLLAGIIVTAPIGITLWLVWQVVDYMDRTAAALLPARYNPETYLPFSVPGLGLLVILGSLTLIGWFTAGFLGRSIMRMGEELVARTPVVRTIYGTLKQIFETVLTSSSRSFREVVLVEWPRRGCWSIGFVTASTLWEIPGKGAPEMVNVFMPCTPNPTTGYLMFVPRSELVPVAMTVEEGMRMVVSGGIVNLPLRPAEPRGSAGREEAERRRPVEQLQEVP
jgi:uncharacterized membrane protein